MDNEFSFLRSSTPSFKLSIQKSAFFFLFHRNRTFLRSRSFSTVWITVLGHFYNPLRLALFYFHIWQKEEVWQCDHSWRSSFFAFFCHFSCLLRIIHISPLQDRQFWKFTIFAMINAVVFQIFFYKVAKNFFFVHFSLFNP